MLLILNFVINFISPRLIKEENCASRHYKGDEAGIGGDTERILSLFRMARLLYMFYWQSISWHAYHTLIFYHLYKNTKPSVYQRFSCLMLLLNGPSLCALTAVLIFNPQRWQSSTYISSSPRVSKHSYYFHITAVDYKWTREIGCFIHVLLASWHGQTIVPFMCTHSHRLFLTPNLYLPIHCLESGPRLHISFAIVYTLHEFGGCFAVVHESP